jgi:MFS family permease
MRGNATVSAVHALSLSTAHSLRRVAPPLLSTALISIAGGLLATLLPLRFLAYGYAPSLVGLLAAAEAVGFIAGCLQAHRLIAPVGQIRAYAAFAALKAGAVLGLFFADGLAALLALRALIGFNAAGLTVIVESWLNALVPNAQRGRILTIYVLDIGLFYGVGQLLGHNLDVKGAGMLILAGMTTALALVPIAAMVVTGPPPPRPVKLEIWKALRDSPASVLACLLSGLIGTAFLTVGPLFGATIGLAQPRIIVLMACVSLGGLFLQWPIGYLSDKIDRLQTMIGLGVLLLLVALALMTTSPASGFVTLAVLFAAFGGLAESLYPVGVAHANDRAVAADYVALSSTLLLVWALGSAIGPVTGALAMQLATPHAFFTYALVLTLAFTLFAIWRLARRRRDRVAETPEEFLTYPQTSPEIYAWLPYGGEPARPAAPSETHEHHD